MPRKQLTELDIWRIINKTCNLSAFMRNKRLKNTFTEKLNVIKGDKNPWNLLIIQEIHLSPIYTTEYLKNSLETLKIKIDSDVIFTEDDWIKVTHEINEDFWEMYFPEESHWRETKLKHSKPKKIFKIAPGLLTEMKK